MIGHQTKISPFFSILSLFFQVTRRAPENPIANQLRSENGNINRELTKIRLNAA
jgi:hypothetical protein